MCYIRIDPNVHVWHKETVLRKVIGVPDSYVIDVDGHHYCQNKRLNFSTSKYREQGE